MQKTVIRLVLAGAGLAGGTQAAVNPAGHWQGEVKLPDRSYALTVDLTRNSAGKWIGSLTFLNSNVNDVPLSGIVINGTAVRFTTSIPEKTTFDGTLSADARSMSGKVTSATGQPGFQLTRYGDPNVKLPPASSPLAQKFAGSWEGKLNGDGFAVILKLSRAADGTALGMLTDVDQKRQQIPITTVTIKGDVLQWEARSIAGTYRGTLGPSGQIAGEFKRGSNRFKLNFKRVSMVKKPE